MEEIKSRLKKLPGAKNADHIKPLIELHTKFSNDGRPHETFFFELFMNFMSLKTHFPFVHEIENKELQNSFQDVLENILNEKLNPVSNSKYTLYKYLISTFIQNYYDKVETLSESMSQVQL